MAEEEAVIAEAGGGGDAEEDHVAVASTTTSNGACCSRHGDNEEQESLTRVVGAFLYYNQFIRLKLYDKLAEIRSLSERHRKLLEPGHSEHTRELIRCIEHNQKVLEHIVSEGIAAFGDLGERAIMDQTDAASTPHFMSKLGSTLKQIAREWSEDGAEERQASYGPILTELQQRFPDKEGRGRVKILMPGVGLGRLAWDVADLGFDAVANEHSAFMLITSYFLLNTCTEVNQFTIYPFVSSSCNRWSYADRTRPVRFPDVCPTLSMPTERDPPMSMATGDFLRSFEGDDGKYSCVVTCWFLDTARNVIEYVEHINRLLMHGGVWINTGPLTYHYSDTPDEMSIELPMEEVLRVAGLLGFRIEKEQRLSSLYAGDSRSMLKYQYDCAFFVAVKESACPA